ncbi:MAG: SRPBCC domain-containing protein [Acidobacteriota bacterium]|nr:SRPBCC domain-containing protein [Acidobacteriota bacterium]MDP9122865.1 SRPBCC domain-containing protein [Acidobacteriota bacterium]
MATATATLPQAATEQLKLSVTRTIRAPRARVFRAWTDLAVLSQWFGPEGFHVAGVEIDLRIGGTYRIEMTQEADPEKRSVATGEYRQIVPNERLQFTWTGCWRAGETSLVTVTFRDADATRNSTEVTILHEQIAAADSTLGYERGWTGSLNKLGALLEAR